MHLISEEAKDFDVKQKTTAPSMLAKATALKNKIIDKTSDILSAPSRAWNDSSSRQYKQEYNIIKNHQDRTKSRVPISNKDEAVYQQIRDRRLKS